MFFLPIIVVFDYNYTYVVPKQMVRLLPFEFIIDIIINLNTGYFDKG